MYFVSNFIRLVARGQFQNKSLLVLVMAWWPHRRQTIIWTCKYSLHWRIYASRGLNMLSINTVSIMHRWYFGSIFLQLIIWIQARAFITDFLMQQQDRHTYKEYECLISLHALAAVNQSVLWFHLQNLKTNIKYTHIGNIFPENTL